MTDNPQRDDLAALTARVDALEARLARTADGTPVAPTALLGGIAPLVQHLNADEEVGDGLILYGGAGPWSDGPLAWEMRHRWADVRATAPGDGAAQVLAALGNAVRLRIVSALLDGTRTTAELAELLDQPSPGQLFHHLRELLAAGIVHQPVRATYALRRQDVVPLLTVLAAAADVAGPAGTAEPT